MKKIIYSFCALSLLVACSPKGPKDNAVSGNTNGLVLSDNKIESSNIALMFLFADF